MWPEFYVNKDMFCSEDRERKRNGDRHLRPKEKYALFSVTCPKFLGSVGRQTFLSLNFFLYGKSMKFLETL